MYLSHTRSLFNGQLLYFCSLSSDEFQLSCCFSRHASFQTAFQCIWWNDFTYTHASAITVLCCWTTTYIFKYLFPLRFKKHLCNSEKGSLFSLRSTVQTEQAAWALCAEWRYTSLLVPVCVQFKICYISDFFHGSHFWGRGEEGDLLLNHLYIDLHFVIKQTLSFRPYLPPTNQHPKVGGKVNCARTEVIATNIFIWNVATFWTSWS